MAELFLPVLSHFQNKNPWSASAGRLRYRALPSFPEGEPPVLTAQVWEGPWAYELAQVEETSAFPLSEEGLSALAQWLEGWRQTMEARPRRSLEEDMARRQAILDAQAEAQAEGCDDPQ